MHDQLRLHATSFHLEQATATVGAAHGDDQQRAEYGQQHARHHLHASTSRTPA